MKEGVKQENLSSSNSKLDDDSSSSYYSDEYGNEASNEQDSFNSDISLEKQKTALKKALTPSKHKNQHFFGQAIQNVQVDVPTPNKEKNEIPEFTPARNKRISQMIEEVVRPPPASQLQNINNSYSNHPQTDSSDEEPSDDEDGQNGGKNSHFDSSYDSEEVERTQRGTVKKPLQNVQARAQKLIADSESPDEDFLSDSGDSEDNSDSNSSGSQGEDDDISNDLLKNSKKLNLEKNQNFENIGPLGDNYDPEKLQEIIKVKQESNQFVCFFHLVFKILGVFW